MTRKVMAGQDTKLGCDMGSHAITTPQKVMLLSLKAKNYHFYGYYVHATFILWCTPLGPLRCQRIKTVKLSHGHQW